MKRINKRLIIILLITLIKTTCFSQDNYMHNAGFEDINFPNNPDLERTFEYLEVWTESSNLDKCIPADGGDKIKLYEHSSDWFNTTRRPLKEFVPQQGYNIIYPHSEESYMGMGSCELIEQRFFNSKPITKGSYILSLYVRPILHSDLGFGHNGTYENSYINVNLAKNKIKYNDWNCKYCEECGCYHDNNYCKLQNGIFQQIDVLGQIPINLSDCPIGQWTKRTIQINIDEDNYDWIGFEFKDVTCDGYILIDDISLEPGCISENCSSTAGILNIITTNIHSNDHPFTVIGLENINKIKIEIWTVLGTEIWEKTIINPQYKVAWNGKVFDSYEATTGTYEYRIYVSNDCYNNKEYTGNFTKINSNPTINSILTDYSGGISKPPLPCCEIIPDIYLNNIILKQDKTIDGPLLYKATNSITANNITIKAYDNVKFQAGNYIELLPNFMTETGAEFTAEIVPCDLKKIEGKYLNFEYVNYIFYVNDTVNFYSFVENYYSPIKYTWNFGNGHFSNDMNPNTTYNNSGAFNISLTITDNVASTKTVIKQIIINDSLKKIIKDQINENSLFDNKNSLNSNILLKDIQINIIPNPCNGIFKLFVYNKKGNIPFKIEISDITGKNLFVKENLTEEVVDINISDKANGFYYLIYKDNTHTITKKIIKQ